MNCICYKIVVMPLLLAALLVLSGTMLVGVSWSEVASELAPSGPALIERIDHGGGQVVIEDQLLFLGPETKYFAANGRVAAVADFEEGSLVEYALDGQDILALWLAYVSDYDYGENVVEETAEAGAGEPEPPAQAGDSGGEQQGASPESDTIRFEDGVWRN